METTGVRQRIDIMHSDVVDTIFQSGDAGDYSIKLSAEVSPVLRSELNKHCPVLSVCDLLVAFH